MRSSRDWAFEPYERPQAVEEVTLADKARAVFAIAAYIAALMIVDWIERH